MPQNTRLIYKNLWKQGTILAKTTESPQFPAVNTEDDDTTLYYQSAPGSPTGTFYISRDLGAAMQYNYVSLLGHRISSGATVQFIGADDSAFTTNIVTDTLTWNSLSLRAYLGTARTKRYVKVSVTDASNPDGYGRLGTLVLGYFSDLGQQPVQGNEDGPEDYTVIDFSPSRNMFVVQDGPSPNQMTLEFAQLYDTAAAVIKDLLKTAKHRAFEICFDYTAPNTNTYWVFIVDTSKPKNEHFQYWTWSVTIEEHA